MSATKTPATEAPEAPEGEAEEAPAPKAKAKAKPKLPTRPDDFDPGIDVLVTDSAGCLVRVDRPERSE